MDRPQNEEYLSMVEDPESQKQPATSDAVLTHIRHAQIPHLDAVRYMNHSIFAESVSELIAKDQHRHDKEFRRFSSFDRVSHWCGWRSPSVWRGVAHMLPSIVATFILAFVDPHAPPCLPVRIGFISLDLNNFLNFCMLFVMGYTLWVVCHTPSLSTLLALSEQVCPQRTSEAKALYMVLSIIFGLVFVAINGYGWFFHWDSGTSPVYAVFLMVASLPFFFFMSFGLCTWTFICHLLLIMIGATSSLFGRLTMPDEENDGKPLPSNESSRRTSRIAPLLNGDTVQGVTQDSVADLSRVPLEVCIHTHGLVYRLMQELSSQFAPMLFCKAFADVSLLLVAVSDSITGTDKTFATAVVLITCVVVAGLILFPSARVTTAFQELTHRAAEIRPLCMSTETRTLVERLIVYLEAFSSGSGTGIRVWGLLLSANLLRTSVAIMYSLFVASSLLGRRN